MPVKLAPHVPKMASDEGVIETAKAALGAALLDVKDAVGEITLTVRRESIIEVCRALRDTPGLEYQQLMDIAAADYPDRPKRFEVNYHLLSLTKNRRIRVKVSTDEQTPVPSIVSIWPVVGWFEREAFDFYGILFEGNPDLRRIFTDYGFEGFPFRKDFPLTGYVEMRYSEAEKRVVYEPVSLPQDFRTFDFLMPWEGPEYHLPGDEKATGEGPGAPTPAPAPTGPTPQNVKTPAETMKTTARPAETGGGKPADAEATKQARKPRAKKAESEVSKQATEQEAVTDARDDLFAHADRADARSKGARTVEVSMGAGSEGRDLGHPRDPGDANISNYTINFGPQHPAAHGVLRLIMELDGEVVERVDPHVGLLHRGTEKLIEYKTYAQALPYFDRLDYCSPMCMEHGFVLAIEKLLGLEIPLRAQYIRTMMAELTRIKNHVLNLGSHIMDVGAMTPNLWLFEIREDLMQIYEHVSGARMHANYFRVGGVREDIPPEVLDKIGEFLDNRLQIFEDSISLVADNRIFKQRNVDIGIVHKDDAIAWGFSGPMIRAPAFRGTSARHSLMKSMIAWTSTFRSAPTATATTASWSGSKRSARAGRSLGSV